MSIKKIISQSLEEVKFILLSVNDTMYQKKIPVISNSTIGKHFRHIIEFYFCLINNDYISYDERKRSPLLESSVSESIKIINVLITRINAIDLDKNILLKQNYCNETFNIKTTYLREAIYCYEHSIHHFALIRIAIETTFPNIKLPKEFGIAPSTIFQKTLSNES